MLAATKITWGDADTFNAECASCGTRRRRLARIQFLTGVGDDIGAMHLCLTHVRSLVLDLNYALNGALTEGTDDHATGNRRRHRTTAAA